MKVVTLACVGARPFVSRRCRLAFSVLRILCRWPCIITVTRFRCPPTVISTGKKNWRKTWTSSTNTSRSLETEYFYRILAVRKTVGDSVAPKALRSQISTRFESFSSEFVSKSIFKNILPSTFYSSYSIWIPVEISTSFVLALVFSVLFVLHTRVIVTPNTSFLKPNKTFSTDSIKMAKNSFWKRCDI